MCASTYGIKKPKDEKIKRYYGGRASNGAKKEADKKRYYPTNMKGNVDEWKAMEHLKEQTIRMMEQKHKQQEKAYQKLYQYYSTHNSNII